MSMDASAAIATALRALQAQAKESSEHLDATDPLLGECKAATPREAGMRFRVRRS